MSNHVNEMLLESYFEHAKVNFKLSDSQAEEYANMRFENEGGALTEAQMRSLMGAPTIEEENTCLCGEPLDECPEAYVHVTSGC